MANWRTIHINEQEWKWVISKGKGPPHIVIKNPLNVISKATFDEICFSEYEWNDYCYISPGNVKAYIEKNLIND